MPNLQHGCLHSPLSRQGCRHWPYRRTKFWFSSRSRKVPFSPYERRVNSNFASGDCKVKLVLANVRTKSGRTKFLKDANSYDLDFTALCDTAAFSTQLVLVENSMSNRFSISQSFGFNLEAKFRLSCFRFRSIFSLIDSRDLLEPRIQVHGPGYVRAHCNQIDQIAARIPTINDLRNSVLSTNTEQCCPALNDCGKVTRNSQAVCAQLLA